MHNFTVDLNHHISKRGLTGRSNSTTANPPLEMYYLAHTAIAIVHPGDHVTCVDDAVSGTPALCPLNTI